MSIETAGWMGNDVVMSMVGEHDPYTHVYGRELTYMRVAATVMIVVMATSVLASIAIVRRILMATSVFKPKIPFLPVFASMKRLLRYNLHYVAVGYLLSFVQSSCFILEPIRQKLKVSYTTTEN